MTDRNEQKIWSLKGKFIFKNILDFGEPAWTFCFVLGQGFHPLSQSKIVSVKLMIFTDIRFNDKIGSYKNT